MIKQFDDRDLELHYARYGMANEKRNVIDCIDNEISANDRLNLLVNNHKNVFSSIFAAIQHWPYNVLLHFTISM